MTPEFAKGLLVTVGAISGMFIGFYVQDQAKINTEKRIVKRVEEGVRQRLLDREKLKSQSLQKDSNKQGL